MTLDRFYPIFDHPDWLKRLLPLGVSLVQLRMKDMPRETLRPMIAAAQALCSDAGSVLVVNDHWQAAIDEGCEFIHLGQEDLDEADLPAIRRAGLRVGSAPMITLSWIALCTCSLIISRLARFTRRF
jgi:thiamine-phosphate pyrophosphorylase